MKMMRTQQTQNWMSESLQARIEANNQTITEFNGKRAQLANDLAGIREVEATATYRPGNNIERGNGKPSWIQSGTFTSLGAALVRIAELKEARLEIPIAGEPLLRECEAITLAARSEWEMHIVWLKTALERAQEKAQAQAAMFAGLTESAKQAHILDSTQSEQQALNVALKIEDDPHHAMTAERAFPMNQGEIAELRTEFVNELRIAFLKEIG